MESSAVTDFTLLAVFATFKESMSDKPYKETLERWHKDPSNWKFGVFYYNKKDKRWFPPKRLRWTGWTVNFAQPFSYISILALVAILVGLSTLFRH
ncbi:MAG: DUF5808 domain-containing protein [Taibaiella sp.]|nr:DUF5808 domain-containing protein [Taibaiella sp.]